MQTFDVGLLQHALDLVELKCLLTRLHFIKAILDHSYSDANRREQSDSRPDLRKLRKLHFMCVVD